MIFPLVVDAICYSAFFGRCFTPCKFNIHSPLKKDASEGKSERILQGDNFSEGLWKSELGWIGFWMRPFTFSWPKQVVHYTRNSFFAFFEFSLSLVCLPPNMTMENPPFEDAFPIQNCDFQCHGSFHEHSDFFLCNLQKLKLFVPGNPKFGHFFG